MTKFLIRVTLTILLLVTAVALFLPALRDYVTGIGDSIINTVTDEPSRAPRQQRHPDQ
jgi:hypothetical protein